MAPALSSWLDIATDSPFSLANIPFGVAIFPGCDHAVVVVAVGTLALNLATFAAHDGFAQLPDIHADLDVFDEPSLNKLATLGRRRSGQVRHYLQQIFRNDTPYPELLQDNRDLRQICLAPQTAIQLQLPFDIGGFSDFYGGMNHAFNAGALFRGPINALPTAYFHMPVAYHSRTSSIHVSGTPVRRPWGQVVDDMTATDKQPKLAPSRTLDFELEIGAFVCGGNAPSVPIAVDAAADNLFGFVLLNDWSARDVQRWEYVPLGPFNGKNFATTISAWVVLADALEPFRKRGLPHPGAELPYLRETRAEFTYDLRLEVELVSGQTKSATTITSTNAADGLVWSFSQMLAHHTITGCPMRPGDLLGSGTISGKILGEGPVTAQDTRLLGCLLEQTANGTRPITLEGGEERKWLEDGDEVILKAVAGNEADGLVGFGDAAAVILPAHECI